MECCCVSSRLAQGADVSGVVSSVVTADVLSCGYAYAAGDGHVWGSFHWWLGLSQLWMPQQLLARRCLMPQQLANLVEKKGLPPAEEVK